MLERVFSIGRGYVLSSHPNILLFSVMTISWYCRSTIRDKIIPHAVSWFTGEAVQGDEFGDIGDDDEDDDENEDDEGDEEDEDEEDEDEDEEEEEEGKSRKKVQISSR